MVNIHIKAKGEGIKGVRNLLFLPSPRQTTAHSYFLLPFSLNTLDFSLVLFSQHYMVPTLITVTLSY